MTHTQNFKAFQKQILDFNRSYKNDTLTFKTLGCCILVDSTFLVGNIYNDDFLPENSVLESAICSLLTNVVLLLNLYNLDASVTLEEMQKDKEVPDKHKILAKIVAYSSNLFSVMHFYDDEDSTTMLSHDAIHLLQFIRMLIEQKIPFEDYMEKILKSRTYGT